MLKKFLFSYLSILLLGGCIPDLSKEHKLIPEAYEVVPYEGNEKLIFESDGGQIDTVFIKGTTAAMVRGGDPFSINPDRHEHIRINYTTTEKPNEDGLLYLSNYGDGYMMRFEFDAGHSRLFNHGTLITSELDTISTSTLRVMDSTYTDIILRHTDPSYDYRQERILNFYWSLSSGLLGWDTPSTEWRLIGID